MSILQRQAHPAVFNKARYPESAVTDPPATSCTNSWDGSGGRYTSAPWEGLHWEADQQTPLMANDTSAASSKELDRFLMSLMYGE